MNKTSQEVKATFNDKLNIFAIIRGIILSYLITIPLFAIFAFILTYTDFPEKFIPAAVTITTVISLLIAGSTASRGIRSRGWLNGGVVGMSYFLVLYLCSSIVYKNFAIDSQLIVMSVIGVLIGAIGGIIGINLKRGHHYNNVK